ncbi:MAG: YbfB/YjiJ family MFS transporter [Burkholderiaceae bacterium]
MLLRKTSPTDLQFKVFAARVPDAAAIRAPIVYATAMMAANTPPTADLHPWQVWLGGLASLILTIGMARFADTPMLPVMQMDAGLSIPGGGWLATANYVGYMAGALLVARIENPVWRHRLYGWGLWLAVIGTVGMALSNHVLWWALVRFLGGLAGAAGMLLGTGLVMNWLIKTGQRAELGLHFMGIGAGVVVSALAAAWFSAQAWTWQARWEGFGAIALLCAVVAWHWRPPVPDAAASGSATAPSPRYWFWPMMLAYFCSGVGFVVSATYTVAIVEAVPTLAGLGAWAWLVTGLAAAPSVYLWDRIARRAGELPALIAAYTGQIASVVLPAVSDHWIAALLAAALFGGTAIGIVSMTLAFVGKRSPQNPGKAMAQLTLGYGAAQIIGPALTAYAVAASGSYHSALWMTAVVLGLGVVSLVRLRQTGHAQNA